MNISKTATVALCILLFFTPSSSTTLCKHSRQCDDKDPSTIDICFRPHRTCLSISTRQIEEQKKRLTFDEFINQANAVPLSTSQKLAVISAARLILAEFNPHRFLYLNFYRVDPVRKLDKLAAFVTANPKETNLHFHSAMISIFSSVNDRHTVYLAPSPFNTTQLRLPFSIQVFYGQQDNLPNGQRKRRYLIYDIVDSLALPSGGASFKEGVEVLTWDGKPIEDAVREAGLSGRGSNSAARIALGVNYLTARALSSSLLPQRQSVTVGFRDLNGKKTTKTFPWLILQSTEEMVATMMRRSLPGSQPHIVKEWTPFVPDAVRVTGRGNRTTIQVDPDFSEYLEAEIIRTTSGPIGRLLIVTFNIAPTDGLYMELTRILKQMPSTGLLIDLRSNPGGRTDYAKGLIELFADKPVPDQPVSVRSSKLMQRLFHEPISSKLPRKQIESALSLRAAVNTAFRAGEQFSGPAASLYSGLPVRERVYTGPVVTLVDALTYSSGDLFTAIQVDQRMSLVVGNAANVGAGGASVVRYSQLLAFQPDIFAPLPDGVEFTTAYQRFYRTGRNAGAIIERFGVKPNVRYFPTREDVLNDDYDFYEFLGRTIASRKK